MNTPGNRIYLAALPAILLTTSALAGTVAWDAGGDGSTWHDALNWSGNVMPGPGDDAVIGAAATVIVTAATGDELVNSVDCDGTLRITGGSLTIAGASTVETLEMTFGALLGAGDVTVNGVFDWSGGTVAGTGMMFADGGIDMSVTTKVLGRRLESSGTTTWTGGQLRIDLDGRFVNMPGALFDEQANNLIWWNAVGPGTFENRGTFRKSAGNNTTDIRVFFDNQGSVEVQTGTVLFRDDSTHSGSIAGTGIARFSSGVHILEAGSDVTADVYVEAGTTTVLGTFDVPSLTIASGTLDVDGTTSPQIGTYAQSSGTLSGDGDVTVSGLMTWTGGTISGSGMFVADGGIEMSFTTKVLKRRLESSGTTTWTGGQLRIDPDGRFVNLPGALFDEQGDNFIWWNSGGPGTFENIGTFRKSAGVNTTDIRVPFDNQGSVEVQTGTVLFRDDSTHSGSVVGAGVARFSSGVHTLEASSDVTADAYVEAGTTTVLGTFDVSSLTVGSGTLDVDGTTALQTGAYTHSNGTLTGDGDVTVSGLMTWTGGRIDGSGTLFADGGIDMSLTTKTLDRRLESSGTTTWNGGQLRIDPDGRFVNMPGALFDEQGDNFIWWNSGGPGTIENRGTFRKSVGTGSTTVIVPIENTGTVEVLSGKMIIREPYTQTAGVTRVETELEFELGDQLDLLGGLLCGTGLVDGFVNNDGGTINPGLSPGQLNVEGDVDQTILGTLVVELGGPNPGEFDVLAIDGDAFLGGLLSIRRFEGYIPPVGLTFPILTTTGTRFGTFDETQCEDFFLVRYLDQSVELEVIAELPISDLNQDCSVGFADLAILLNAWGPCSPPPPAFCLGDLNGDGGVGFADLSILLNEWG